MQPFEPTDDPRLEANLEPDPSWNEQRPEYRAFARFAKLTRTQRSLKRQLKEVNEQLDSLKFQLREYLGEQIGGPAVHMDGYSIFLRRDLWARKYEWVTMEQLCQALKGNGMGQFVSETCNANTLSSHVRCLELAHKDALDSSALESVADLLPPDVAKLLNVEPSYNVIAKDLETLEEK